MDYTEPLQIELPEFELREKVLNNYFPNLNNSDKDFVFTLYLKLLEYIYFSFFENEEDFIYQLRSNNYQDGLTILLLLFPFLKKSPFRLSSLDDLYSLSNQKAIYNSNLPLPKIQKYLPYTNSLITFYNKYKRVFSSEDIRNIFIQNYLLIISSIRQCSNKLMVNWNNLFPMKHFNLNEYFVPENETFINKTMENLGNPDNQGFNPGGLWVGDIYNFFNNQLYRSILPIKFLIFAFHQDLEENDIFIKFNKPVIYGIELLLEEFNLNTLLTQDWELLSNSNKKEIIRLYLKFRDNYQTSKIYNNFFQSFFYYLGNFSKDGAKKLGLKQVEEVIDDFNDDIEFKKPIN